MKTAVGYYDENPGEGDMQGVIPNMRNTTFDQQTATNVKNHLHLVDVIIYKTLKILHKDRNCC